MTDTTADALADIARPLLPAIAEASDGRAALAVIVSALRDAFELGQLAVIAANAPHPTTPTADEPRNAFGQVVGAEGPGFLVEVRKVITAEQIAKRAAEGVAAEHVVLAWILQSMREIASNGGNPLRDASVRLTGKPNGDVLLEAEGRVGA